MVNIYDENNNIIGKVNYSENLDFYDGRNLSCGSVGYHQGLTKLKNGEFVLIHGSNWQGDKDYAEIITPEEALQEILKSENIKLLEEKRFGKLKKLYHQFLKSDFSEDDEE